MRKLSKACSLLSALAVFAFFAAGNILTVIVCGGVAALFALAAHILNRV